MNSINNNLKILRIRFCEQRTRKTYFDNVRRLCTSMEGALARIKSQPIADPYATMHKILDIRVNRFIPLTDELQQLDKLGIKMPRNIHSRLYRLENDMKNFIEQLEKMTKLR